MEDSGSSDLGSNPRGTTKIRNEFKALVPHIEAALNIKSKGKAAPVEMDFDEVVG